MTAFQELHKSGCFVIPNPWDIGSARYLARLGFRALATTSAGFAFSRGLPDSGVVTRQMALDHIAEIVGATQLPVNADFQNGYAPRSQGRGGKRPPLRGDGRRRTLDRRRHGRSMAVPRSTISPRQSNASRRRARRSTPRAPGAAHGARRVLSHRPSRSVPRSDPPPAGLRRRRRRRALRSECGSARRLPPSFARSIPNPSTC